MVIVETTLCICLSQHFITAVMHTTYRVKDSHTFLWMRHQKLNFSWCLVHRFHTVHIMLNQSCMHKLIISAASVSLSVIHSIHLSVHVCLSVRLFVSLSSASLCVCPSRLSAYVRLSIWYTLSAGQCLNGGPCHISLGLSYWVPLHLSNCHQQLPSGNLDHFLDLSLNSSHCCTFSWGQSWHLMVMSLKKLCYCGVRNSEE